MPVDKKSARDNTEIRRAQQVETNMLYECAQEAFNSRLVRLPTFRLRAIGFNVSIVEAVDRRAVAVARGTMPDPRTEDIWDFNKAHIDASFAARDAFRIVVGANRALRGAGVKKDARASVLHSSTDLLALAKFSAETHTTRTSALPAAVNRVIKAPRNMAYSTQFAYPAHAFAYDNQQESLGLTAPFLDWIQQDREQQRADGLASVRGCPARLMTVPETAETGPANMLEAYWHQYIDRVYVGNPAPPVAATNLA